MYIRTLLVEVLLIVVEPLTHIINQDLLVLIVVSDSPFIPLCAFYPNFLFVKFIIFHQDST